MPYKFPKSLLQTVRATPLFFFDMGERSAGGELAGLGGSKAIWDFPKIRATLFWGPYNKDPTMKGTILGSPIFGNPHLLCGFKKRRRYSLRGFAASGLLGVSGTPDVISRVWAIMSSPSVTNFLISGLYSEGPLHEINTPSSEELTLRSCWGSQVNAYSP